MGTCTSIADIYTLKYDQKLMEWQPDFDQLNFRKSDVIKLSKTYRKLRRKLYNDASVDQTLTIRAYLDYLDVDPLVFINRILSVFKSNNKLNGKFDNLREFVLAIYNFCTLDEIILAKFAFLLYDDDKMTRLSVANLIHLTKEVYSLDHLTNPIAIKLINNIQETVSPKGGGLTQDQFFQFTKTHPSLLYPVILIQEICKSKTLGKSLWAYYQKKRNKLSEDRILTIFGKYNPILFRTSSSTSNEESRPLANESQSQHYHHQLNVTTTRSTHRRRPSGSDVGNLNPPSQPTRRHSQSHDPSGPPPPAARRPSYGSVSGVEENNSATTTTTTSITSNNNQRRVSGSNINVDLEQHPAHFLLSPVLEERQRQGSAQLSGPVHTATRRPSVNSNSEVSTNSATISGSNTNYRKPSINIDTSITGRRPSISHTTGKASPGSAGAGVPRHSLSRERGASGHSQYRRPSMENNDMLLTSEIANIRAIANNVAMNLASTPVEGVHGQGQVQGQGQGGRRSSVNSPLQVHIDFHKRNIASASTASTPPPAYPTRRRSLGDTATSTSTLAAHGLTLTPPARSSAAITTTKSITTNSATSTPKIAPTAAPKELRTKTAETTGGTSKSTSRPKWIDLKLIDTPTVPEKGPRVSLTKFTTNATGTATGSQSKKYSNKIGVL